MDDQEAENIVLLRRELYLLAVNGHKSADKIDAQSAAFEGGLAALLLKTMAQGGADACDKFGYAKRLRDIIVGSEIQGLNFALLVAPARQDDDRQFRSALAHLTDHVEAVQIRQA